MSDAPGDRGPRRRKMGDGSGNHPGSEHRWPFRQKEEVPAAMTPRGFCGLAARSTKRWTWPAGDILSRWPPNPRSDRDVPKRRSPL